jgi:hypothetical protein
MTQSKVVSLDLVRQMKDAEALDPLYEQRIARMDKLELLEEMVRFQEERSRSGQLTLAMMIRGRVLFRALEANAETQELKILSGSYRRHLEHEEEALRTSVLSQG